MKMHDYIIAVACGVAVWYGVMLNGSDCVVAAWLEALVAGYVVLRLLIKKKGGKV